MNWKFPDLKDIHEGVVIHSLAITERLVPGIVLGAVDPMVGTVKGKTQASNNLPNSRHTVHIAEELV